MRDIDAARTAFHVAVEHVRTAARAARAEGRHAESRALFACSRSLARTRHRDAIPESAWPRWWVGVRCTECCAWVNLSILTMTDAERTLAEPLLERCAPPFVERLPWAFHACTEPILRWEWREVPNPYHGCAEPPKGR